MRFLVKITIEILKFFPYWISHLFPRNKNVWIFGALYGKGYADNAKYLYNYVHQNHKNVRAIWLTKMREIIIQLQKEGKEAYHFYSLKGMWYALTAKCVISTHEPGFDVPGCLIGGTKIIQLYHGTPLKRITFDDPLTFNFEISIGLPPFLMDVLFFFLPYRNLAKCDIYCTASEQINKTIESAFRLPPWKIKVTGQPRTDILLEKSFMHPFVAALQQIYNTKKIIAYAPTFNYDENGEAQFDFDEFNAAFTSINLQLKKMNAILLLRLHPIVAEKGKESEKIVIQQKVINGITVESLGIDSNIVLGNNKEIADFYPVLKYVDVLITDYSSIYIDYLMLNRPVIFFRSQKDKIINHRGLYYDYDEVTPGPKVSSYREMMAECEISLKDKSVFADKRLFMQNKFHKYIDSNSSSRVYDEVSALLKMQ